MSLLAAHQLLNGVEQLPVLPRQTKDLLRFSTNKEVSVQDLLNVVEHDPILSAMVLRVVNSAAFGLGRAVTNLSHAVVLLGTAHVRSLALAASMTATLAGNQPHDESTLWRDAFAVACASRVVASHTFPMESSTAFAAGLLHHIGDIALRTHYPVKARMIDQMIENGATPLQADRAIMGATHCELGTALSMYWALPEVLSIAILWHHGENSTNDLVARPAMSSTAGAVSVCVELAVLVWAMLDGPPEQDLMTLGEIEEVCSSINIADADQLIREIQHDVERHLAAAGLMRGGAVAAF